MTHEKQSSFQKCIHVLQFSYSKFEVSSTNFTPIRICKNKLQNLLKLFKFDSIKFTIFCQSFASNHNLTLNCGRSKLKSVTNHQFYISYAYSKIFRNFTCAFHKPIKITKFPKLPTNTIDRISKTLTTNI